MGPVMPQMQKKEEEKMGLLERLGKGIQNYRSDPEKMARLQMGFNTMRLNPDPNIAANAANTIKMAQQKRQSGMDANATIARFKQLAVSDPLAARVYEAMIANPSGYMDYLKAYANEKIKEKKVTKQILGSELGPGFDQTAVYNKKPDGSISKIGGTAPIINNNMSNAEDEGRKVYIKDQLGTIKSDLDGGEGALQQLQTIGILEQLSPVLDGSPIPNVLKKYIPEGIDSATDAYQGQLVALIPALRVKGSGTQTDKDAEQILQRAGSISQSSEARAIAHAALRKMAQRKADLANLASAFYSLGYPSAEERVAYFAQRREILNRPIIAQEQLDLIKQLKSNNVQTFDDGAQVMEID
jgi:hypothetical protein